MAAPTPIVALARRRPGTARTRGEDLLGEQPGICGSLSAHRVAEPRRSSGLTGPPHDGGVRSCA